MTSSVVREEVKKEASYLEQRVIGKVDTGNDVLRTEGDLRETEGEEFKGASRDEMKGSEGDEQRRSREREVKSKEKGRSREDSLLFSALLFSSDLFSSLLFSSLILYYIIFSSLLFSSSLLLAYLVFSSLLFSPRVSFTYLLCLCKEVLYVLIEHHTADTLNRHKFLRNDLCRIEQIKVKLVLVFLLNDPRRQFVMMTSSYV
jgi:hypothetical protein